MDRCCSVGSAARLQQPSLRFDISVAWRRFASRPPDRARSPPGFPSYLLVPARFIVEGRVYKLGGFSKPIMIRYPVPSMRRGTRWVWRVAPAHRPIALVRISNAIHLVAVGVVD